MNELPTTRTATGHLPLDCPMHLTLPACPDWCAQVSAHPFDCVDETGEILMRFHRAPLIDLGEDVEVNLVARETALSDQGPAWVDEPHVELVDVETDAVVRISQQQAARLITGLRRAVNATKEHTR